MKSLGTTKLHVSDVQLGTVLLLCRIAKEFDTKSAPWSAIPRFWNCQREDFRTSHTTMLPQHNNRKRLLEPATQECVEIAPFLKGSRDVNRKRQAEGMCGYGHTFNAIEDMSMETSKSNASGGHVDKELSTGQASQNPKPKHKASKLEQVRVKIDMFWVELGNNSMWWWSFSKICAKPSLKAISNCKQESLQNVGAAHLKKHDMIMGGPPQIHKGNNPLQKLSYQWAFTLWCK